MDEVERNLLEVTTFNHSGMKAATIHYRDGTKSIVYAGSDLAPNGNPPAKMVTYYTDKNGEDCESRDQFAIGPKDPKTGAWERNGYTPEELLQLARLRLMIFEDTVPCPENRAAITSIEQALVSLDKRRKDRAERGSLGTKKP